MTFGEQLKSMRKETGLSVEDLAGLIGYSRSAVQKWEHGDSSPRDGELHILNLVSEAITGLGKPPEETVDLRRNFYRDIEYPEVGTLVPYPKDVFNPITSLASYVFGLVTGVLIGAIWF